MKTCCIGGRDVATLTLAAFGAKLWWLLSVGDGFLDQVGLRSDVTIEKILQGFPIETASE